MAHGHQGGCGVALLGIMRNMEATMVYWGYKGIMENQMETTIIYWGSMGIMENQMETTIIYWGSMGIMENQMETITLNPKPYSTLGYQAVAEWQLSYAVAGIGLTGTEAACTCWQFTLDLLKPGDGTGRKLGCC